MLHKLSCTSCHHRSAVKPFVSPSPARRRVPVPLRVPECVHDAAWTRQSQLHTPSGPSLVFFLHFFFSISHTLVSLLLLLLLLLHHLLLLVSLQPHVHTTAEPEQIPCPARHTEPAAGGRRSPLSGARMRCHKFLGPCSVGFYICAAMLFKGRKVALEVRAYLSFLALCLVTEWVCWEKWRQWEMDDFVWKTLHSFNKG